MSAPTNLIYGLVDLRTLMNVIDRDESSERAPQAVLPGHLLSSMGQDS